MSGDMATNSNAGVYSRLGAYDMPKMMTVGLFLKEWQQALNPEGYFIRDERFKIDFIVTKHGGRPADDEGFIKVTFIPDGVTFSASDTSAALNWMVAQAPPEGSLRLGNVVSTMTRALGIQPCNACKQRQLALNRRF